MVDYEDLPVIYPTEGRRDIYIEEMPASAKPFKDMLVTYSKIPAEDVDEHIYTIVSSTDRQSSNILDYSLTCVARQRDNAWAICKYPCVGGFVFTTVSISSHPIYAAVLSDLLGSETATLLDMGCCFAQDLRRLAADGVASERLYGADLRLEFLELGYELFRDKSFTKMTILGGDVLAPAGDPAEGELARLDGTIDYVYANHFIHLFSWKRQIECVKRLLKFMKRGGRGVIFGQQMGSVEPCNLGLLSDGNAHRFSHNVESLQDMFREVGRQTETEWEVKAELKSFDNPWAHSRDPTVQNLRLLEFEVRLLN